MVFVASCSGEVALFEKLYYLILAIAIKRLNKFDDSFHRLCFIAYTKI